MKLKTLFALTLAALATLSLRAQDAAATTPVPAEVTPAVSSAPDPKSGIIEGRIASKLEGKYLTNARIRVKGSIQEVLTDEYGDYRLVDLPAGETEIEVYYSGLEPLTDKITLKPGERLTRDYDLIPAGMSAKDAAKDADLVLMEKYSVTTKRDTSGASIAINEQRFSQNMKSVIDTEAFGESANGNVGEFLKFMPGVTVDYDGPDASTVSVRGFSASMINVTTDGGRVANAGGTLELNDDGDEMLTATSAFQFDSMSINNLSRVELSLLSLPSQSASSIGGSINFVSKNAFERKRRVTKYTISTSFNSENLEFMRKTPGPMFDYTYKAPLNFTLDNSMPITRNLALTLTASMRNRYSEKHSSQYDWNFYQNPLNDRNLQSDPYLQKYTMKNSPSLKETNSLQARADWRAGRDHVFSFTYKVDMGDSLNASREMGWDATETATNSNTNPFDPIKDRQWGYDEAKGGYYVESAEGKGSISQKVSAKNVKDITQDGRISYRYTGNNIEVNGRANASVAKKWQRDTDRGYWGGANTKIKKDFGRVGIYGINDRSAPDRLAAYKKRKSPDDDGFDYGEEVTGTDIFTLDQYNVNTVSSAPYDIKTTLRELQLNVRRSFGNLPFYAEFMTGGAYDYENRDYRRFNNSYTFLDSSYPFISADLIDDEFGYKRANLYADEGFSKVPPGFGLPAITWVNNKKLYQTYLDHPEWFTQTLDQRGKAARYEYEEDYGLSRATTAFFFQLNARFFHNRLNITTGARYEAVDDRGQGLYAPTDGTEPKPVRSPYDRYDLAIDGPVKNKNTINSEEDIRTNWIKRGSHSKRQYDGIYPSLHAKYNISENLIFAFAWGLSYKAPNLDSIIPNTQVKDRREQDEGLLYESEIKMRNPNLDPYKANSWNGELSYYTKGGGSISVNGFYIRVKNDFAEKRVIATAADLLELGLPTDYEGFTLVTKYNLNTPTTTYGVGVSADTRLNFIPGIGRFFTVFANANLKETKANPEADSLSGSSKQAIKWGIKFKAPRLSMNVNFSYQGEQRGKWQTGKAYQRGRDFPTEIVPFEGFFQYTPAVLKVNASMSYSFSKTFSFAVSANDITNTGKISERYNAVSEKYAPYSKPYQVETYGVLITMGISGSF